MDQRERFNDLNTALLAFFEAQQAGLWTALPGIVESFDPDAGTVAVQPTVKLRLRSPDGEPPLAGATLDKAPWWWVSMPLLPHVPVVVAGGGGFVATFPIAPGDEVLVVFSSRCFDDWWQGGKEGIQTDLRMHDLSDGFALVGPRSLPRALGGYSTDSAQLRSVDGETLVEVADGVVRAKAAAIELSDGGALHKLIDERFKVLLDAHTHAGVVAGGGVSGVPTVPLDLATMATQVTEAE